ncbi:SRPBCC family protein [Tunturiibacter lichenicola]|uniref:SRPBCC family protein n=1 Tax=Tunturiibacter lichenicola TaxID=2051959 RepID=UPI003D9BAD2A
MERIRLETWIDAPVERCFLLSLSVDLHIASAHASREKAVAGVTTGLINKGETVTFQGRHFGLTLNHTSRIEILRPYSHVQDVMIEGRFEHFEHDHHFAAMNDGTRMRDEIRFSAPWGVLGRLATSMFLRRHLTAYLEQRNALLKQVAECEEWHKYLDGHSVSATPQSDGEAKTSRWNDPGLLRGSQS